MLLLDVRRRRVLPALVSGVIRRTRCAGDADVARTTSRSRNVRSAAIRLKKCVRVSHYGALWCNVTSLHRRLLCSYKYRITLC